MAVELIANWSPLEETLTPELCAEFMWMYREGGIEHYKHIVTRRYLRLNNNGRCLVETDLGYLEVPFEQEWKRVSGRIGGGQVDGDNGTADQREDERSEVGRCPETTEASGRPSTPGSSGGRSVFRRPTCRRRQQAHPGAGSGERAGSFGDRVQE